MDQEEELYSNMLAVPDVLLLAACHVHLVAAWSWLMDKVVHNPAFANALVFV